MPLVISDEVRKKLATKHQVTEDEIRQCFMNMEGDPIRELRAEHQTDPPTYWFVAETDRCRKLKVVFMAWPITLEGGKRGAQTEIKTAFPPSLEDLEFWERHGKC